MTILPIVRMAFIWLLPIKRPIDSLFPHEDWLLSNRNNLHERPLKETYWLDSVFSYEDWPLSYRKNLYTRLLKETYWLFILIRRLPLSYSRNLYKRPFKETYWLFILIQRLATVISKKSIQETFKWDLLTWLFILIRRLATVTLKESIQKTLKRDVLTLNSHTKIGHCRYGHKCMFAHTKDELRTIGSPLLPAVAGVMTLCDMTHLCVWHDAFICMTWFIHVWGMTHSYVRHDSFICVT